MTGVFPSNDLGGIFALDGEWFLGREAVPARVALSRYLLLKTKGKEEGSAF